MMNIPSITGIILAGGRATRMGGQDKGLVELNGKPLYQYALERLQPQVNHIMISANRNQDIYAQSGYPIISDSLSGFYGPLSGMLTGLEQSLTEWVLFVPCDTPFIPEDLTSRLWNKHQSADIIYAYDGERAHPTIVLINKRVTDAMHSYLIAGDRKLMLFIEQQRSCYVDFSGNSADIFINFNMLEECQNWENRGKNR